MTAQTTQPNKFYQSSSKCSLSCNPSAVVIHDLELPGVLESVYQSQGLQVNLWGGPGLKCPTASLGNLFTRLPLHLLDHNSNGKSIFCKQKGGPAYLASSTRPLFFMFRPTLPPKTYFLPFGLAQGWGQPNIFLGVDN